MNVNEIVEIIRISDEEDVMIFDENYKRILKELPEGDEKTKYCKLRGITQTRLKDLMKEKV